jgi:hypothetical protein
VIRFDSPSAKIGLLREHAFGRKALQPRFHILLKKLSPLEGAELKSGDAEN